MKKFIVIILSIFIIGSYSFAQHPIPFIDATHGLLLGASNKGELIKADDANPFIKGGEIYKLYDLNGYIKSVIGEKTESLGPPCDETLFINTSYKPNDQELFVTGIACNWNPFPKTLKITSTNQKVYQDIIANILIENGLKNPIVELTDVIRTDIENDGIEEVLICATHYKDGLTPDGISGDYSLVYLRKIINGKPENIQIESNVYAKTINSAVPSRFKIANILDLNNDGIMEIIIYSEYYEGYSFSVYQIIDNKPAQVLSAGCGA
jgi:hypothetical protein